MVCRTTLVLIAYAVTVSALQNVYFVRPTEPSRPETNYGSLKPCYTLSHYCSWNNFTSGTEFVFLPGNHSILERTFNLRNISNVTLQAYMMGNVYVMSKSKATVQCKNVTNLVIDGLSFVLNSENNISPTGSSSTSLKIIKSRDVSISKTKFQGAGHAIIFDNSSAVIL